MGPRATGATMTATPPAFHVDLPLEVTISAARPSDQKDPCWAVHPTGQARTSRPLAWMSRDELTVLGVDVDRLQRWGESEDEYRARRVFEALGAASTCWEHLEAAGVFQSERAAEVGRELLDDLGIDPPVGYKVVLRPHETGRVEFHETDPVTPEDWATPDRPEPPPLHIEVTDFEVVADTGDEVIPETMFAGTEPQDVPAVGQPPLRRFWTPNADLLARLRSEQALSVMVNAIGWVALGGDDASSEPLNADGDQVDLLERAARRARSHLEAYLLDANDGRWGIPVPLWDGNRGVAADDIGPLVDRYGALGVALTLLGHPDVDDPVAFLEALPDAWRRHTAAEATDAPAPAPETPDGDLEAPAVNTPTWMDSNGVTLRVGDRVRDVDSGTVGVLDAAEAKYPPMAARFLAPNGGTYLVIPHADLELAL